MNNNALLNLRNISKIYKQGSSVIEILKDINFTVNQGELIAIIGSSGSGKSTLLHIAGLLDKADNGEVEIENIICDANNSRINNQMRLNYIGFVYQYHHLLKDFNARENVALPKLIAGGNYNNALEEADQLLHKLGLFNKIYNMPGELSGGEQQRVAIARSMINKPKLILADEPTGNLDPHTANEVFNLLLNLAMEQNTAIIMVTHNYVMANKMHKMYELKYGTLQLKIKENA